jgi:hypothetical protein
LIAHQDRRRSEPSRSREIRHLIHVGYPKTGSTLLQQWFEQHPQIGYHPGGIAGFSGVYDLVTDRASLHGDIRVRVTSDESLVIGNSRPGKALTDPAEAGDVDEAGRDEICRTLAALFPTAIVLLVTRGMREMLLSSHSQHVRIGGSEPFVPAAAASWAARGYDYARWIERYRAAFGSRLLVLPYELLRDDPRRFAGELEARLGLDHVPLPEQRINPSLSPVELVWYPRLSRAIRRLPIGHGLRKAILRRFVPSIGTRRLGMLVRLLQRVRPATPLTIDALPEEVALRCFAGTADLLRDEPAFQAYAAEYLFSPANARSPHVGGGLQDGMSQPG